jgi:heme/copper-type cytochrome/quinol oxidase subunit 3
LSEDNHKKHKEEHKERKHSSGVDLSLSICCALFALFFALFMVK